MFSVKKIVGTILAAAMLAGTVSNVFAVSTIAPNEVVYGYQSIDFESGYTVGETVMSNPLSGGQISKDGQLYCSVEGDGGTKDSVKVTIDGNDVNKYLKIVDTGAGDVSPYANFKMLNPNNELGEDMDYFVLKCKMKNGDSMANAVKNLHVFRGLTFNEDGNIFITGNYDSRYMPKQYDWNDYMFVADKSTGTLYTAVNGKIIDSLTHTDSAYASLSSFLGLQFYTAGTKMPDGNGTFYMDDMELYGVKKDTHEVTCTVEKDEYNSSVIYASFTQPVKFDETNVSVASTVSYENGKYKITVADVSAAGTDVVISGVTDIYGSKCADVHTNVSKEEKKFYQVVDFENYGENNSILNNGNASSDGIWYMTEIASSTYKVVQDGENKALEVYVPKGVTGGIVNAYNKKASTGDSAEYLVMKYRMKNGNAKGEAFPFIGLFDYALRRDETDVYPSYVSTGSKYNLGQNVWNEYMFVLDTKTNVISAAIDGVPTDLKITSRGTDITSFYKEQWTLGYSGGKTFDQRFYLDDIEMYGIDSSNAALKAEISEKDSKVYVSFNHPAELNESNITIDNGASVSGVARENGQYVISFANLSANKSYNVTINNVADMFGCTLSGLSASFNTGALQMPKNYLTVSKFTGSDDFENYDGIGIVRSPKNPTVTITNTKTGYRLDDAWTMNSQWGAEYALVKDGDNTVLKISVPGTAADGNCTTILQPDCEVGNYTDAVKGNVYVYSLRFKSGSENEASFGETAIEDFVNPINLNDGTVAMFGKSAKRAFGKGEWVDFKYVIDWTGENQVHYAIADGRVIDSLEKNLSEIKSSTPRIAAIQAIEGAVDSAIYIDDIEVYTTHGISGNLSVVNSASQIKTGEGLTVQFSQPVANLTAENIEGAPAELASITTLSDNKCVINFKEALAEGSYTIKLKNVEDVYKNTLESYELSFDVVSGGKLEGINDVLVITKKDKPTNVTVTTKNTGAAQDGAKIIVAAYDENGMLTGALTKDVTVGMGINDYELSGTLKGVEYKTFIWDGNMKSLCGMFKN